MILDVAGTTYETLETEQRQRPAEQAFAGLRKEMARSPRERPTARRFGR